MRSRLVPLALAGVLTLSACSGSDDSPIAPASAARNPASTDSNPSGATSGPATPMPTLPVAEAFGAPVWGLALPETSQQHKPVVTSERVIFLDGAQVRSVDQAGKDAWSTTYATVNPETRTPGTINYPLLRLADPKTVAVIDQGQAKGQGLNDDRYEVMVTLLNVGTGAVVKTVTLPGTKNSTPVPSEFGLGFNLRGQGAFAVLPDGSVKKILKSLTAGGKQRQVTNAATVGSSVVTLWGGEPSGGTPGPASGFGTDTWDSVSSAPSAKYTDAAVTATDADRLLVGRWNVPNENGSDTVKTQVLDASSGKVLSTAKCEPSPSASVLSASPNRQHFVNGPLRVETVGKASCLGGGQGQKTVDLTAVTDSGRAFGRVGSDLIDVSPDGTVKTVPLPQGAGAPIGVMNGDVAVHWDAPNAVITGNPIR